MGKSKDDTEKAECFYAIHVIITGNVFFELISVYKSGFLRYMEDLTGFLYPILENPLYSLIYKEVLRLVGVLGEVCSKKEFSPYCNNIMPILVGHLKNENLIMNLKHDLYVVGYRTHIFPEMFKCIGNIATATGVDFASHLQNVFQSYDLINGKKELCTINVQFNLFNL